VKQKIQTKTPPGKRKNTSMHSLNKVKRLASRGRDPARSLPLWRGFLLIPLILVCFAVLPQAQAQVCEDGCNSSLFNTFQGDDTLLFNTTGLGNTAFGWRSLFSNSTGNFNTAMGPSLILNHGDNNTAVGTAALLLNDTGLENSAVGVDAMVFNTTGEFNDAVGGFALFSNTDGFENEAFGDSALFSNVIGAVNTAVGDLALAFNDSDGLGLGNNNVAVGGGALVSTDGTTGNIDGSENTAVGTGAGPNVVAGFNNTYLGDFVGTTAADESSTIRIGDLSNGNGAGSLECFIGGIFNNFQPVNGTNIVQVTINLDDDHLGWDFGPNQGGKAPAPRSAPQRRSVPQSRERPQLQHQAKNDKVEKLEATVAQQQKQIETLTAQLRAQAETFTAQLKEQAAQIQKVSAQVEMIRPAPRVVENR
jgi:hypothetical protein